MTSLALTYPRSERERLRFELRSTMGAPREARRAIQEIWPRVDYPDLQFMTQLLAAELVSNVVRHSGLSAGETFELVVAYDDQTVRFEVSDPGSGFNPLLFLRTHSVNGSKHRGIALVDALSDRWGFLNDDNACRVWFEIDLTPGHRPWNGRQRCGDARRRQEPR